MATVAQTRKRDASGIFTPQDAAFLHIAHLSIVAASHDAANQPFLARALGCRLGPRLRNITLFFSRPDAGALLADVASNGKLAVVFSLPATHQSLQVKGPDARIEQPLRSDFRLLAAYRKAFLQHLIELGYPGEIFQGLFECHPADVAAVVFSPEAVFSQTPGPGAGHPVGPAR